MTSPAVAGAAPALPSATDVEAAAETLAGIAVCTPLLESPPLNERLGGRLLIKAEPLQRTGSFKLRGAYNCVAHVAAAGVKHVVAYSSGNHAQGVAAAARMLGLGAGIVMPADAPEAKRRGTAQWGAELVLYDRATESREDICADLAESTQAAIVPPFDHPHVIAGQGTVGLEIAAQARTLEVDTLDAVLVPCSGGGLSAGIALALGKHMPGTEVWAVEPRGFDDTRRSLAAGQRLANDEGATTCCDALMLPLPGELTFAINRTRLSGGLAVSDADTVDAMALAFSTFHVVVEPGGAVALAAVLSGACDIRGRTVAVVLSGGNVDRTTFARLVDDRRRQP